VTIAGSTHGNNVTNATIKRVFYGSGQNFGNAGAAVGCVWVALGSQTDAIDTFTATIKPVFPNGWQFAQEFVDTSLIGTDLVVATDPLIPTNVGTYRLRQSSGRRS